MIYPVIKIDRHQSFTYVYVYGNIPSDKKVVVFYFGNGMYIGNEHRGLLQIPKYKGASLDCIDNITRIRIGKHGYLNSTQDGALYARVVASEK